MFCSFIAQFPKTNRKSREHHQYAPRNVYLRFGHVCCFFCSGTRYIIARHVNYMNHLDDCKQRPVCSNTGFAWLRLALGQNGKQQSTNSMTPNVSTTNPNPTSLQFWRQATHFDTNAISEQFFQNRVDCCKFRFDPLDENGEFPQHQNKSTKTNQFTRTVFHQILS